ncbi:subtilisin-like protease PR1F [Cordyceps fumosorosea ARSEF 2679]|uniref:Subtilisin-like protease PR1F n=1 Tax=Cordyceps fumosorosea (strain ARSEF 2679) TaxID=1081104 RepID=A0A167LLQ2_CORFA|nr:subtilisin-like protease PR1F [Cordyceps fumosorosea ARSEF 2679]OAA53232.1 subtilisin-like protease PR1F [Cordyceps fumosorosea ARSEF 2679]
MKISALKAPWNLRAISHRSLPKFPSLDIFRNFKYYYQSWTNGKTYYAYVIDSGVRVSHKEFEGCTENLWTAFKTPDGKDDFEDQNGHGTLVAGIIASKTYGVAKSAKVISLRALDAKNQGRKSISIKTMEQAIADIAKHERHNNAVINMSLGGECSRAQNEVINRAFLRRSPSFKNGAGILFVTASGNENVDASTYSPASAHEAITVGTIDKRWKSIFSLLGRTGTSMAAPHVAAVALNAMAVSSKMSTQVRHFLTETGTKDKITGDLRKSPNVLVNNNNGKQESCARKDPRNEKEDDEC